jgi:nitrogen fixation protein
VSISIDKKDIEKMEIDGKSKELGGVQVFADNDWNC